MKKSIRRVFAGTLAKFIPIVELTQDVDQNEKAGYGRSLHAWVVPNQASIGDSGAAFDFNGTPIDPEVSDRLTA